MRNHMNYADYIDITGTLDITDYYKTDTHWRQEKLPETAVVLAKGMGTNWTDSDIAIVYGIPADRTVAFALQIYSAKNGCGIAPAAVVPENRTLAPWSLTGFLQGGLKICIVCFHKVVSMNRNT